MVITYHGENYLKVQSGNTTVLIDPTDQRSFKGAALALSTVYPAAVARGGKEDLSTLREPLIIDHEGEYEIAGIRIQGVSAGHDGDGEKTCYFVEFDGITLGILGHLTHEPDRKVMEILADLDILFIPVGGKPFLTPAVAGKIVRQLEPGLVVPTLTKDPASFLKEMGNPKLHCEEKLTVKKKDVASKAMRVVCLTP